MGLVRHPWTGPVLEQRSETVEQQIRYATKDIEAEIEEEGGKVNRLVAVAGQPVPPAFADYVDDKDTTTEVPDGLAVEATRSRAARMAAERPEEASHEDFRRTAEGVVGEPVAEAEPEPEAEVEDEPAAPRRGAKK